MPETERGHLDGRIARLASRLAASERGITRRPGAAVAEAAAPAADSGVPIADRIDLARKVIAARLSREIRPDRWRATGRRHLARVIDAAVHAHALRYRLDLVPLQRRNLITDIIHTLVISAGPADRHARRDPTLPLAALTLDRLAENGGISPAMAAALAAAVRRRRTILVSGEAGAGKTGLLAALCRAADDGEPTVIVEDFAELPLPRPHTVRLELHEANRTSDTGLLTMRDLFRNALMMGRGRIVLGECRDADALDMLLQAIAGGCAGAMTTVVASSPEDALRRLEDMLGIGVLRQHRARRIAAAFHLICHVERLPDSNRRVTRIAEVTGAERGTVALHELFVARDDLGPRPTRP